ncbi:MAG TPA: TOBE domain-containing protein [Alphaproteobacteria bacterium]|jgi:molybdopterin-binding protein|nr:TOBE domain-containing protein [Alphaproteobacteria bacterium]
MKISARNILKGKVIKVSEGIVNTEVLLELTGGAKVVSMISKDSAKRLGLKPGKKAYAIIKASSVMMGVD